MSLTTILLIIVVLMLVGALPSWGYSRSWGLRPVRHPRRRSRHYRSGAVDARRHLTAANFDLLHARRPKSLITLS
jgi:RNase P/RNase MRP subunit p30